MQKFSIFHTSGAPAILTHLPLQRFLALAFFASIVAGAFSSQAQAVSPAVFPAAAAPKAAPDYDSLEAAFVGSAVPLPFAAESTSLQNISPQHASPEDSLLPDAPQPADAALAAQENAQQSAADQREQQKKRNRYCKWHYCPEAAIDWYMRFENGPQVRRMTPREKGWLAARNVIDPFNIITILGISAISVAADSHSAYGPGFPGWGRYVGVSFTEDITSEFFGTFLICSIAHQDPHYHRLPDASIKRRIAHAVYQIAWTQGDNGRGMVNYATLVGAGIDDLIANTYVPGRDTSASATAQRYGIALATAPIGNFITEFLPDVASRIHVQVVVVQRIIDQIATNRTNNGT
jgi:hypothetical protein